jgi:large subunit ribosomal protein L18
MKAIVSRKTLRQARDIRVAKKLATANRKSQYPRLSINKSLRHFVAQIINDAEARTLVAISSYPKYKNVNQEIAGKLGEELGAKALAAGIKKVVLDRGGFIYHGQVKAFAEGVRKAGLEV